MLKSINVITLPKICFSGVPAGYVGDEKNLTFSKFIINTDADIDNAKEISRSETIEADLNNKTKSAYVNLKIRKYLKLGATVKSGAVQSLTCDYYIFNKYDVEQQCFLQVKDILDMQDTDWEDPAFYETIDLLNKALEFDMINENDYVKMAYTSYWTSYGGKRPPQWHLRGNHNGTKTYNGIYIYNNQKVVHLSEVLNFALNKELTTSESDKIKKLLASKDTEKIGLTILNSINPNKSFVEILCLINHMCPNIKRDTQIPVLPLLEGAYLLDNRIRRADTIVSNYTERFGQPSTEILERIADTYHNPRAETSSVFNFKLNIKK